MKILHYSDHHSNEALVLLKQVDILFTTGDLSIFDLREIESEIHLKPSFGVYGNHCVPGYMEEIGIKNMHLRTEQFGQFLIGGYQGCPRYKNSGGPQFTEDEAVRDLSNFPRVDILLLHAAPFELLDTPEDSVHTGSKAVREYIDRTKPLFIFCGHDSPSLEMTYGQTKIYRTHETRIVEI